jgi:hypothetical protein
MTEQELINAILDAANKNEWLMAFSISLSLIVEGLDRLHLYKAKLDASPVFGWVANLIPQWAMLDSLSEAYKKLIVVGLSGLGALTYCIAQAHHLHVDVAWGDAMKLTASSACGAAGFHSLALRFFPKGPTPPQLQP